MLHGGSGIQQEYVLGAIKRGIAKVNVGTEIRQAYEQALRGVEGQRVSNDVEAAQQACYQRTYDLLTQWFEIGGIQKRVAG